MTSASSERTFDRLPHFDPRNLDYPVMATIEVPQPRSYTWTLRSWLDQGSEGACVGFACSHELAAKPRMVRGITNETARAVYKRAQVLDEWPGENYSGSSVLAGMKVLQEQEYIKGYTWAFSADQLAVAVSRKGPAVLGVNWYTGMFNPNENGFLSPIGSLAGGHAILCLGYNVKARRFTVHNSWGLGWGRQGRAFVHHEDMDRLLKEGGDAAIPVY